jgi:hypothetical protein
MRSCDHKDADRKIHISARSVIRSGFWHFSDLSKRPDNVRSLSQSEPGNSAHGGPQMTQRRRSRSGNHERGLFLVEREAVTQRRHLKQRFSKIVAGDSANSDVTNRSVNFGAA